jgi:hypothetical protein
VRTLILAMCTLFVVLVLGVTMADSTFAFHPLFLTLSSKALSFTGTSKLTLLRGLNGGFLGTIDCEKGASSGQVLSKSTLALKVELEYSGKCEQTINGSKSTCTEPIKFKLTFGELGLNSKKVVLLLAPESGTEFAKVTCGGSTTTVEGAVVAEFPETNSLSENQYSTTQSSLELVFQSENKNENQAITSIELSGVSMTKAELKINGFFGGKASLESTQTIWPDAGVLICTASPAACGAVIESIFEEAEDSGVRVNVQQGGMDVTECNFRVIRERCVFRFVGFGRREYEIERAEVTGNRAVLRYTRSRVGCVVRTRRFTDRSRCTDEVERINDERSERENEYCVNFLWEFPGNTTPLRVCTRLKIS